MYVLSLSKPLALPINSIFNLNTTSRYGLMSYKLSQSSRVPRPLFPPRPNNSNVVYHPTYIRYLSLTLHPHAYSHHIT